MRKKINKWKWRIYKAGLTQSEFCTQFSESPSQLSEWINGVKAPMPDNFERIEGHLKSLGV